MKRAITCALALWVATLIFLHPSPAIAPQDEISAPIRTIAPDEAEVARNAKIERIDRYFAERNMPLAGYGAQFADVADRYGLDWRLLPAISIRESSGGKQMCGHNPFGWASCRTNFESVGEAIGYVGLNLAGENPRTAPYYKNKTTREKLWSYNGTVNPKYPDEVLAIMEKF
jgi:hypothetical protein